MGAVQSEEQSRPLTDAQQPDDPRLDPRAQAGWEWVTDIHAGQAGSAAERSDCDKTSG